MQKYQHFIWFLIAAVLQANVAIATSEMAASSDNPCEVNAAQKVLEK